MCWSCTRTARFPRTATPSAPATRSILVLPKVESKNMQAVKDISQVLMQVAVSTGAVLGLPFLQ